MSSKTIGGGRFSCLFTHRFCQFGGGEFGLIALHVGPLVFLSNKRHVGPLVKNAVVNNNMLSETIGKGMGLV